MKTKGPVLCNIMVAGRVVTDAVIAMQMEPEAILSLPTLAALGGQVTVAGIELLPVSRLSHDTSVRQVRAPRMLRVTVKQDEVIPAKSQKVVPCQIQGRYLDTTLVLESAV